MVNGRNNKTVPHNNPVFVEVVQGFSASGGYGSVKTKEPVGYSAAIVLICFQ